MSDGDEKKLMSRTRQQLRKTKAWKMIDGAHLYSSPIEALLKLLGNTFIMMATVYCYFNATTRITIIGVATLTYVISYVGEIINWIDKNANILHKIYISLMLIWIVILMAASAYAIFGDIQNGKSHVSINHPLITICFIPLIIQFVDLLLTVMVSDYPGDNNKRDGEKPAECRLRG